jgi:hypothetical protein
MPASSGATPTAKNSSGAAASPTRRRCHSELGEYPRDLGGEPGGARARQRQAEDRRGMQVDVVREAVARAPPGYAEQRPAHRVHRAAQQQAPVIIGEQQIAGTRGERGETEHAERQAPGETDAERHGVRRDFRSHDRHVRREIEGQSGVVARVGAPPDPENGQLPAIAPGVRPPARIRATGSRAGRAAQLP